MSFTPLHQTKVVKTCPDCEHPFSAHPFTVYCGLRCKHRAEVKRRRVRDAERLTGTAPTAVSADTRQVGTIENPTRERLLELASQLATAKPDTFFNLYGAVPAKEHEWIGLCAIGLTIDKQWYIRRRHDDEKPVVDIMEGL